MDPLQLVSERQGIWSETANRLKAQYETARWRTFLLSIGGAMLATLASQVSGGDRKFAALAAALCFAIAAFITARSLGNQNATLWLRARAASEALKKEAFTYAAGAAPYDDPLTRKSTLNQARDEIERSVDEIIGYAAPTGRGSAPKTQLTPEEYVKNRVEKQIVEYFEPKANAAQRTAARLRWVEGFLALAAAVLSTAAAVIDKHEFFDIAAIMGVVTTISSALVAHISAGRYDFTVASYRATARRLRNVLAEAPETFNAPSPEWSAFVNECESILWDANNTWLAKWAKPSDAPATAPSAKRIAAPTAHPQSAASTSSERVVTLAPPPG
jgi:hypothetical protein